MASLLNLKDKLFGEGEGENKREGENNNGENKVESEENSTPESGSEEASPSPSPDMNSVASVEEKSMDDSNSVIPAPLGMPSPSASPSAPENNQPTIVHLKSLSLDKTYKYLGMDGENQEHLFRPVETSSINGGRRRGRRGTNKKRRSSSHLRRHRRGTRRVSFD